MAFECVGGFTDFVWACSFIYSELQVTWAVNVEWPRLA